MPSHQRACFFARVPRMKVLPSIDTRQAGIGLRAPHYAELIEKKPPLGLLEIHSENFFGDGGPALKTLESFRAHYPISCHGVGLSLGSTDPISSEHLAKLKRLVDRIEPAIVSEHLCWVGVGGHYLNDLLPLPYTEESLDHMVARIDHVQNFLGRQILIENLSSYLEFSDSTIPEWEFIARLAARSGCGILLDVNNIYVNACNHGFDALVFLNAIRPESVGEIHLAGHENTGELLIDTHGAHVSESVWALYEAAIARFGQVPTLIEWDTDIPDLAVLIGEATRANAVLARSHDPHR